MIHALQHLVDEFRKFNNGLKEYRFNRLDLIRSIQQAMHLVSLHMEEPVAIAQHFPDEALWIEGDADRLQQVFANLLTNSIQAIVGRRQIDGRIDIHAATQGKTAIVRVCDNGPGVATEMITKLFHSYASTKTGGMGLGLSLTQEILRRHGGKLEYNPHYTAGAEFIVRLPLAAMASASGLA
jgi:C4-dicarboxylate-specific signal transduction histidine kinase